MVDPQSLDFEVCPRPNLFLGVNPTSSQARWGRSEDSVGIVGPPRYGKTSGLITPMLYWWSGPAIVASTRGDVLHATGDWRSRGDSQVYVYDPFGSEPGLASMRWTPLAGCTDPALVYRRVSEMTAMAGAGLAEAKHWQSGAARILRGAFHAAALEGLPLSEVMRWLALQDVSQPAAILEASSSPARSWGASLSGLDRLGDRERGSFFSVALETLEVIEEPTVRASTEANDLDIDAFLSSRSTLYVVSPSHYQAALAPMIVGLITAITQRAAELAQASAGGRLDPPLLVALDEVSNIAPLDGLAGLVSEGAGRGIITMWADQTLDRLRERYGAHQAAAIFGASSAKLVYGGMANDSDLRMLSAWEGEHRETQTTRYAGGGEAVDPLRPTPTGIAEQQDTGRQHSQTMIYRPVLPPERLRQTPEGQAWLWYRSDAATLVATPPSHLIRPYQRLAGYTPVRSP